MTYLAGGFSYAEARQEIGIIWEVPASQNEATVELELFKDLGITVIEIPHAPSAVILDLISVAEINVIVRSGPEFAILSEMQSSDNDLAAHFLELAETYRSNFNILSIGLFTNSQVRHKEFSDIFSAVFDTLYSSTDKNYYFVEGDSWFYFHRPEHLFAQLFDAGKYEPADLHELNAYFTEPSFDDKLILLHSEWLLNAIESYPELRTSLIHYKINNKWLLPLPEVQQKTIKANYSVLVLFGLWLSLAILLRLSPISRPMIMRYLLSHRFYSDDILHYRERSAITGFTLLLQHIIFSGLAFFVLSHVLFSDIGLQTFFHHLPALAVVGRNYFSFFVIGSILATLIPFISLIWLHFTSKNLRYFSQTINLYAGIFFLDFILVTAMLTLYLAGTGSIVILVLGAVFLFSWFAAFYIVSLDVYRFMSFNKGFYLLFTSGLLTLILILTGFLIFNSPRLIQIFQLSSFI